MKQLHAFYGGLFVETEVRLLKNGGGKKTGNALNLIYRSIDVVTAVLILSGQITVTSVWLTRGAGFGLSFTGDILGGERTEATPSTPGANVGIYTIGMVTALLIILDQVNVIGVYLGPGRFSIVIGGPAFGSTQVEAYTPTAREFFTDYRQHVFNTFDHVR